MSDKGQINVNDLVTAFEVGQRFGVEVETVYQWQRRYTDTPAALTTLGENGGIILYDWAEWEAWGIKTKRLNEAGRPTKHRGGRPKQQR